MKSLKSKFRKDGQVLLSLVETTISKNVHADELEKTARAKREKKANKIRSNYDQIQDLQTVQLASQTLFNINDITTDQNVDTDDSLWLCIYLPQLSIDIKQDIKQDLTCDEQHRVTYQEQKGQCMVYRMTEAVADCGVSVGMSLDAARILCPEITALLRDEKAEGQHIQKLADWAYRYSSYLSIINNDTLILEIGSSTRLFKGLKTLCELIAAQLSLEWKLDYRLAVTPTPLASMTLAQQIYDREDIPIVLQKNSLRSVLGKLPISSLLGHADFKQASSTRKAKSGAFTLKDINSLKSMGINNLNDLWRLPQEGLLTRFGIEAIHYLERLLGKQINAIKLYEPAMHFSTEWELPLAANSNTIILQTLSQLLDQLVAYLTVNDVGTDEIKIGLIHDIEKQSEVYVNIRLRQYSRDKKHIFSLIEERFNRVTLKAPVVKVNLTTVNIEAYNAASQDLFEYDAQDSATGQDDNSWKILLEQFNARLGENKIASICTMADHRPERAWSYQQEGKRINYNKGNCLLRPMWLLAEAIRVVSYQAQFELLHGPERIENGWWDEDDIRRDYYIARDKAGVRLWVYCDLKHKDRWYVHGLFA
ncbi:hypothetical protein MNBD_GAMMA12-1907 [hydrothermal vent metagenome]|uniref:UmuC domain-containing protein n=1 Tax=hydrothermal vent metagenome TaxID=652676 RepID=A0A3B0Z3Q6_9ZZZZ